LLQNEMASEAELNEIEKEAAEQSKQEKTLAWEAYSQPVKHDHQVAASLLQEAATLHPAIAELALELKKVLNPDRLEAIKSVKRALWLLRDTDHAVKVPMRTWLEQVMEDNRDRFNSHLLSESSEAGLKIKG